MSAVAAVVGVGVAGVVAADVVVAVVVVGGGGVVVADVVAVVVGGVAVVAVVVGGVVVVAVVGLLWVGVVVNAPPGEVHCLSRVDVPKSHAGLGALYGLGSLVECAVAVAVVVDNFDHGLPEDVLVNWTKLQGTWDVQAVQSVNSI